MSLLGNSCVAIGVSLLVFSWVPSSVAGPPGASNSDRARTRPNRTEAAPPRFQPDYSAHERQERLFRAAVETIKPLPLTPIPDDPPPHEGAMFDLPYVVEPPDIIVVEVLETLAGRPITGERLVRSDGTISLGFYGSLYVRGLTVEQIKTKLILHLRHWLSDEALGLFEDTGVGVDPIVPVETDARPVPPPAQSRRADRELDEVRARFREQLEVDEADRAAPQKRRIRQRPAPEPELPDDAEPDTEVGEEPRKGIQLSTKKGGKVAITITVDTAEPPDDSRPPAPPSVPEGEPPAPESTISRIPPGASSVAFVDIGSHNSKSFFVLGDVATPGKYPWTGHDTVLDAIQNARGFLPTAEASDIRLVRPARAGKPARTFKVNYKAIVDEGDSRQNFQLFPGDRLIVGRNPLAQKTVAMDRLYAPVQTALHGMTNYFNMLRALSLAAPDLTPAQRQAIVKESAAFWWRWASNPEGARMDQKAFEEALTRHLDTLTKKPAPSGKK